MNFDPEENQFIRLNNCFSTPTLANEITRKFCGAIYDDKDKLVKYSQRTQNSNNEWTPNDPDMLIRPESTRKIRGNSLYLGHYTGHYGHFLLETLSRFWIFFNSSEDFKKYDNFIFHPFLHKTPSPDNFSPANICFKCFGLDISKIILITEPTHFENLTVPQSFFEINHRVRQEMGAVYKEIRNFATGLESSRVGLVNRIWGWGKDEKLRLFISRRKARGYRPMVNERAVERAFAAEGFKIFHPERWKFEQQVAIFDRTEVLAGVEGSALHNSVFMKSGGQVISIGTPRVPSGDIFNQRLCDSLSGVQADFIGFKGSMAPKNRAIYDIQHIKERLPSILKAG